MSCRSLLASSLLIAAASAAAEQATPDVLAQNRVASGGDAWPAAANVSVQYRYVGQGMTGTITSTFDARDGDFVDSYEIGPTSGANGFDGDTAWTRDMSGALTPEAGGDLRALAVNEAYRNANQWWRPDHGEADVSSATKRTEGGMTFDVLSITPRGGKPFDVWFDAKTHLLARTVEMQQFTRITTFFSDYRPARGVQIAGKLIIDDGTGAQYRQTETLVSATFSARRAADSYAMPKVALADARIMNDSGRTTVPFDLFNNHIYAKVRINGKGPFLCIFDTGGHDLLQPETARSLGIKVEGASPGTGAGEAVVTTGFARHVTYQVGDLVLRDKTISVLPITGVDTEGFDEQGMVGFEIFRRFVTVVDYGAKTLTFIDPARFDPQGAGIAVPFVFYNHLPQVKGTFEGRPGRFDIDTGSRDELTLTKPFVDAHQLVVAHPRGVIAVDGWGVGGRTISYVTRGADLTLGPVRSDNLVVGFATQSKGALSDANFEGNVGSGFLKRFAVTFDYAHQTMYLKALPAPVPDTDVFDRAGFWINLSPKGFKVADLTQGGAAAKAGVKADDEITAVDGIPARSIALPEARRRFRDEKPGTIVRLTIARGAQILNVSITLADQI
jgi:hypothetical protein